jgi:hypothetical protein
VDFLTNFFGGVLGFFRQIQKGVLEFVGKSMFYIFVFYCIFINKFLKLSKCTPHTPGMA